MNAANTVIGVFARLNNGEKLQDAACSELMQNNVPDFQCASLAVKLASRDQTPCERDLLVRIFQRNPEIRTLISAAWPYIYGSVDLAPPAGSNCNACILEIIARLRSHERIGDQLFIRLISGFMKGEVSKTVMSAVLALVRIQEISEDDAISMTKAMVGSGEIVDYRPFADRMFRRILRRYPTGGVSEKVSLILPSLLLALSNDLPIFSTTLVARSLGFTGGTWDKLKSIPGFRFPYPGQETEATLKTCNVAMCTTDDKIAPADRDLYLLRSQTGNVEVDSLIISSIASKHLALPPHRILLDVRFGESAFLKGIEHASLVASKLKRIFNDYSIPCTSLLVGTSDPTGVAVGNALEVLEALLVMGAHIQWPQSDPVSLDRQRRLVSEQSVELCCSEFANLDTHAFRSRVNRLLSEGVVLKAFWKLLSAHSVPTNTIQQLETDPARMLLRGLTAVEIFSPRKGQLKRIDLKGIGNIVNFGFVPLDLASDAGSNNGGVWLHVQEGSQIMHEEKLCTAFFDDSLISEADKEAACAQVAQCFELAGKTHL